VAEVVGWCRAVVQPLEEVAERKQPLIKHTQEFGV
jgi:hypothetical protein